MDDALIVHNETELDDALNKYGKGLVIWDETDIKAMRTYTAYVHSAWQTLIEAFYADKMWMPSGMASKNLNYMMFYTVKPEKDVMPWLCALLGSAFASRMKPQKVINKSNTVKKEEPLWIREAIEVVRRCIEKDGDLPRGHR